MTIMSMSFFVNLKKFDWARGKMKDQDMMDMWGDCDYYDLWGAYPKFWYYQGYETFLPYTSEVLEHFMTTIDPLKLHEVECTTDAIFADKCSKPNQISYNIAADSFSGSGPINRAVFQFKSSTDNIPIVVDTGASTGLSPVKSDFFPGITPVENVTIQQVSATATIQGKGPVEWFVKDNNGNRGRIETFCNYMPEATVRLFSPQHYFQMNDGRGKLTVDFSECILELANGETLTFSHDRFNNLPITWQSNDSIGLSNLTAPLSKGSSVSNVLNTQNTQNITQAQQELLGWHWKLAHASMSRVQQLMKTDQYSKLPVLKIKNPKATSCNHPLCASCLLSRPHLNNSHLPPRHRAP